MKIALASIVKLFTKPKLKKIISLVKPSFINPALTNLTDQYQQPIGEKGTVNARK
jgi:hypothetical protein